MERKFWGPGRELKDYGALGFEKLCPRCELILAPLNPKRYGKGAEVHWKTKVVCPGCRLIIPIDYWRGTWEYQPEE